MDTHKGFTATVRDADGDTFPLRLPLDSEDAVRAHAARHGLEVVSISGAPATITEIPESARRDEKSAMTWVILGLLFVPAMIPALVMGSRAKEASGGRLGSVPVAIAGFGVVLWLVGLLVLFANAR